MQTSEWIALANLVSVAGIPLIVYLHNSNKARWRSINKALKKIGKGYQRMDARVTRLELGRAASYTRPTAKSPVAAKQDRR